MLYLLLAQAETRDGDSFAPQLGPTDRQFLCHAPGATLTPRHAGVFCWRHHKNPVGTEWRWAVDEPGAIVAEAQEKIVQAGLEPDAGQLANLMDEASNAVTQWVRCKPFVRAIVQCVALH